ncbi:MAG: hypothetical protein ACK5Y2_05650 [Bdellovibrionales bacterium]
MSSSLLLYFAGLHILQLKYTPRHWDEFSYWLTYPKQMFLFGSLIHSDFPNKTFVSYLPGLPALQMLNQTLSFSSAFQDGFAFNVNFLFITCGLGLLWSELLNSDRPSGLSKTPRGLLTFSLFILLCFVLIRSKAFIVSTLVEAPSIIVTFCFFYAIYLRCQNLIQNRDFLVLLGLSTTCGYALKEYFILAPGAIFLYFAVEKMINPQARFIVLLRNLLFCSVGLLVVMFVWKFAIQNYRGVHNFAQSLNFEFLVEHFRQRRWILGQALGEIFLYLLDLFILVFPLWGVSRLLQKSFLKFWTAFLGFFAAYLAILIWWYLFVAVEVEALRLASFSRYLNYVLVPLFIIAYLHFCRTQRRWPSFLLKSLPSAGWVGGAFASLFFVAQLKLSPPPSRSELNSLSQILQGLQHSPQKILLIDQQDNGFHYLTGLYYSLDHEKLRGRFARGWAYAEESGPNGFSKVSSKEFGALANQADVLWVRRSNEWTHAALAGNLDPNCKFDLSFQFLIKNNDRYSCFPYEVMIRE